MAKKMYLDSNFFVASQLDFHTWHTAAVEQMQTLENVEIYISWLVIDEILHAFRKYGVTKEVAVGLVTERLLHVTAVVILPTESNTVYLERYLHLWQKTLLKPRDAMHFFLMKQAGVKEILTFDKQLKKVVTQKL
jgi:predicted nucleic acid-binding protein